MINRYNNESKFCFERIIIKGNALQIYIMGDDFPYFLLLYLIAFFQSR